MIIIYIPGAVIAALTFPGVILHEIAHKFFCDFYSVPVYEVKYFAISEQAGHVKHCIINDPRKNAIIALAPLFVNTIVSLLFLIPTFITHSMGTSFISSYTPIDIFLIWVGISCAFNAVPSKTDLAHIENNAPRLLYYIKKLAQILNFIGPAGGILWWLIILIVICFSLLLINFSILMFLTLLQMLYP